MTTTTAVTREQAEAVLAKIRAQFKAHCATHAETAEIFADDPDLVRVLTQRPDGTPKPEAPQPKIVEDFDWLGTGDPCTAIVWEEGPYEWTYAAIHGGTDQEFGGTIPAVDPVPGVHTEAYTTWALGAKAFDTFAAQALARLAVAFRTGAVDEWADKVAALPDTEGAA